MSISSASDRQFAETVAELAYCNPFLARRTELERQAIGREFDERYAQWNVIADATTDQPNLSRLLERTDAILRRARETPPAGVAADAREARLREDLIWFAVYHRFRDELAEGAVADGAKFDFRRRVYEPMRRQIVEQLGSEEDATSYVRQLPHMAALFFQLARAFHHIFHFLLGASRPAVELRAAVWQSIFTHDMRRYRRVLFDRLGDYATLITGPSGTGKELAARAVGLSRYVPYDERTGKFSDDQVERFLPLNLSALSPALVESELFGHRRGAFTGAAEHREGRLEVCSSVGTVFLDEIGELTPTIQVKLLRVLQDRTFQRLGENETRTFRGKLISATNRDLTRQMRDGEFREDLYYRLCSDIITTPSLRARLDDDPSELRRLVTPQVARMVEEETEAVVDEVLSTVEARLGPHYAWPGNVRELEQCVRNVVIRRDYTPARPIEAERTAEERLAEAFREGRLTADELVGKYCAIVYAKTGSYEATADVVKLDRRTVKAKIEAARQS